MSQPNELVDALKRALRRQGLSYAKVAQRLGVSESTIKRAFARGNFTLQRMADICAVANTDIGHLAALAEEMGSDKKTATAALDAITDVITKEVSQGGAVTLPGVG